MTDPTRTKAALINKHINYSSRVLLYEEHEYIKRVETKVRFGMATFG